MQVSVIQTGGFNRGVNSSVHTEHSVGGGAVVTNCGGGLPSSRSKSSCCDREDPGRRK